MYTELCKKVGIDVPIFAFTHCRDVAVEVSKAGGLGCLGSAFMMLDEFRENLNAMDKAVGDRPYGVDLVFNPRRPGKGEGLSIEQVDDLVWKDIPQQHREFAEKLMKEHGVPEWPEKDDKPSLGGMAYEVAMVLTEEALRHPKCKVFVSAMGTPPPEMVDMVHAQGRMVGALTGSPKHALQHKAAGLDFIIANGWEGGGHVGAISSIVLWPNLVDVVAPLPVLAAGGIGNGRQVLAALATGAQGVWTGSLWLCVQEALTPPKLKDRLLGADLGDTVVSKSWSGKTARYLRNEWTDAWEGPDSPGPLPSPQQWLLTTDARRRTERYAEQGKVVDVAFAGAGQVIGQIKEVESTRDVMARLMSEYADAFERVAATMPG